MRKIVSLITTCLIFILGVYFIYNYNKDNIVTSSLSVNNKNIEEVNTYINGGICLVGIIDRDNDGWYIDIGNSIDIVFNNNKYNISKIRIYDLKLVNIESFYRELVTLKGVVNNQDDILYLIPYIIIRGKNIDNNIGISNVNVINNDRVYDSNIIYDNMRSINNGNGYKYNYYMLDNESLEYLGNDFVLFYNDFVRAFLNYQTSVKVYKKEYVDLLISILDYEFPVFFSDGEYDFLNCYNEEDNTFNWKYKSKNIDEHKNLLKEFENNANMFLNGVSNKDSDSIKAQKIYNNLSKVITYNSEGLRRFKNLESYYVYKNKSGISHSISNVYCQLLTQVDVFCTTVVGISNDKSYTWSLFKVDNDYYFGDITKEIGYNDGKGYKYFGIGLSEIKDVSDIIVGRYYYKSISEIEYKFDKKINVKSA